GPHPVSRYARGFAAARRRGAAARVRAGGASRSRVTDDLRALPVAPRRPPGLGWHVDDVLRAGALRRSPAVRWREPPAPAATPRGAANSDGEMLAEMRRGIWETTELYAETAEPGWLAVTCDSPTMAAWMCAAIIVENVGARVDNDRLLLPAGPDYQLKDEVKSIVTVVAKTHHYWQAHVADTGRGARAGDRG